MMNNERTDAAAAHAPQRRALHRDQPIEGDAERVIGTSR
jgi:hypothetical protein